MKQRKSPVRVKQNGAIIGDRKTKDAVERCSNVTCHFPAFKHYCDDAEDDSERSVDVWCDSLDSLCSLLMLVLLTADSQFLVVDLELCA